MMTRHPRILVCRPNGPGGVAQYYNALRKHLPERVSYFIVHDPGEKKVTYKVGKLILRIPSFVKKALRVDVICVNPSLYPRSYYRDMMFLLIAKMLKRKTVVFFRGWSLPFGESIAHHWARHLLFRMSYGRADGFIVLGDIFRKKLVSMSASQEKIFIETTVAEVCPDFDPPTERRYDASRKVLRLLFLSRIVDGKGWMQTIDFAKMLVDRLPDWEVSLTMAGDGPALDAAKAWARQAGLNCRFTGRVEGQAKLDLYTNSDIYILHSETEGLPNTILEAMACGLIIVSTPVGAIPEIVEDGVNGVLIREDLEVAADRLVRIMESGATTGIMHNNVKKASSRFLPSHCAARFMKIMDSVAQDVAYS